MTAFSRDKNGALRAPLVNNGCGPIRESEADALLKCVQEMVKRAIDRGRLPPADLFSAAVNGQSITARREYSVHDLTEQGKQALVCMSETSAAGRPKAIARQWLLLHSIGDRELVTKVRTGSARNALSRAGAVLGLAVHICMRQLEGDA
jgi:hypothetical protein